MRLELSRITAAYGAATVLRDVDLVVPASRVVALLGPNGAGKTTLLNVASGLLTPRAGSVLIDGVDHTAMRAERRAVSGLCHVTESDSIYPGLTVSDNLRMFVPPGSSRDAVARAIDAFPSLGNRLGQQAGSLSGGEQRMLSLARAYVRDPALILVDEISLGLAPLVVEEIFGHLAMIASQGTSLLLVEQYVSRALGLADFVYVLARGRIVFAGEPVELAASDLMARYLGEEIAPTSPADYHEVRG
jgi:branched-chain amino acid transport system ATP-binding protein